MDSNYTRRLNQDAQCSAPKNLLKNDGIRRRGSTKRARRACFNCRKRKVRCVVVAHGSPCSNCRYDKLLCKLPQPRRSRKEMLRLPLEEEIPVLEQKVLSEDSSGTGSRTLIEGDVDTSEAGDLSQCRYLEGQSFSPPGANYFDQSDYSENMVLAVMKLTCSEYKIDNPLWLGRWPTPFSSKPSHTHYPLSTPQKHTPTASFFKGFPSRMSQDDIEYLRKKDALSIPQKYLQMELLRAYKKHAHLHFPILDLQELEDAIEERKGNKISMFLFQALMFAGSTFADTRYLNKAGFASQEEAQIVLFHRARLLYDFDTEPDHVTIIQALFLMTHSHSRSLTTDGKDSYYWLGLAISLSHSVGLHQSHLLPNLSSRTHKLWRRIWWSCFIRDCVQAIQEGKPPRIQVEDYTLPMLSLEDFDLGRGDDGMKRRVMADMVVEKAMLSWCTAGGTVSRPGQDSSVTEGSISSLRVVKEPPTETGIAAVPEAMASKMLPSTKTALESYENCCDDDTPGPSEETRPTAESPISLSPQDNSEGLGFQETMIVEYDGVLDDFHTPIYGEDCACSFDTWM